MKPGSLAALVVAVGMLLSCGGGGSAYSPPAPQTLRTDLLYGYYLTMDVKDAVATADHTNFVHEGLYGARSLADVIASMKVHGKPVLLEMHDAAYTGWPHYVPRDETDTVAQATAIFDALRAAGLLQRVIALYPMDEPETKDLSDEQVSRANSALRLAASRYPELGGVKLAVIYSGSERMPGFASYDWIGVDAYDLGPGILASELWTGVMGRLGPKQRALLVPGGASPWKTDPEAFRRYAHSEPKVVGIIPFIWHWPDPEHERDGIDSNGMANVYRALGKGLTGN